MNLWIARLLHLCCAKGCWRFHLRGMLCCRQHVTMEPGLYQRRRFWTGTTLGEGLYGLAFPPTHSPSAMKRLPWWQRLLLRGVWSR